MINLGLKEQIAIHKEKIVNYELNKKYWLRKMLLSSGPAGYGTVNYSGMPKGSRDATSLDRILENIRHIEEHIELEEWAIEAKENMIKEMDAKIAEVKDIRVLVAHYRDCRGLRLWQIAEITGKSEEYIRRISAQIKKMA